MILFDFTKHKLCTMHCTYHNHCNGKTFYLYELMYSLNQSIRFRSMKMKVCDKMHKLSSVRCCIAEVLRLLADLLEFLKWKDSGMLCY